MDQFSPMRQGLCIAGDPSLLDYFVEAVQTAFRQHCPNSFSHPWYHQCIPHSSQGRLLHFRPTDGGHLVGLDLTNHISIGPLSCVMRCSAQLVVLEFGG